MNKEKINEILLKLKSKAESAKEIGNESEYELFISKVNELMLKYDIDSITIEEQNHFDDVVEDFKEFDDGRFLVGVVAKYFDCKILHHSVKNKKTWRKNYNIKFSIIGTALNIKMFEFYYDFIYKYLKRAYKEEKVKGGFLKYCKGAAIYLQRNQLKKIKPEKLSDSFEIVLADKIKLFVKDKYGEIDNLPMSKGRASESGYDAAKNITLQSVIDNSPIQQKRLN